MRLTRSFAIFFFIIIELTALCNAVFCDDNIISYNKIKECEDLYAIDATYPQIRNPVMKASSHTFNGLIENYVKEEVSHFNSYCKAAIGKKSEESLSLMRDNHWYLKIDPELGINTHRLISILLSGDVFTGYMHSQQFYSTITFDIEEGKELKLRHLFKKNIKYLDILSSYCIDSLSAKLHPIESKPDYQVYYLRNIKNGASAKEDNYRYFYLTPESIVIVFPPYQVASYAAGTQKVCVPYSFLKDSLSPEYYPIEKNQF